MRIVICNQENKPIGLAPRRIPIPKILKKGPAHIQQREEKFVDTGDRVEAPIAFLLVKVGEGIRLMGIFRPEKVWIFDPEGPAIEKAVKGYEVNLENIEPGTYDVVVGTFLRKESEDYITAYPTFVLARWKRFCVNKDRVPPGIGYLVSAVRTNPPGVQPGSITVPYCAKARFLHLYFTCNVARTHVSEGETDLVKVVLETRPEYLAGEQALEPSRRGMVRDAIDTALEQVLYLGEPGQVQINGRVVDSLGSRMRPTDWVGAAGEAGLETLLSTALEGTYARLRKISPESIEAGFLGNMGASLVFAKIFEPDRLSRGDWYARTVGESAASTAAGWLVSAAGLGGPYGLGALAVGVVVSQAAGYVADRLLTDRTDDVYDDLRISALVRRDLGFVVKVTPLGNPLHRFRLVIHTANKGPISVNEHKSVATGEAVEFSSRFTTFAMSSPAEVADLISRKCTLQGRVRRLPYLQTEDFVWSIKSGEISIEPDVILAAWVEGRPVVGGRAVIAAEVLNRDTVNPCTMLELVGECSSSSGAGVVPLTPQRVERLEPGASSAVKWSVPVRRPGLYRATLRVVCADETFASSEVVFQVEVPSSRPEPAPEEQGMLDCVLCIDRTGSMYDDIQAVKEASSVIVQQLAEFCAEMNVSLRVGLVTYQDHTDAERFPPDDQRSHWLRAWPLAGDWERIRDNILSIEITDKSVGGDFQEDVYAALLCAMDARNDWQNKPPNMGWRKGAAKIILLMGDAPPHDPDWQDKTMADVVLTAAELDPVHVYPLVLPKRPAGFLDSMARWSKKIASSTGGEVVNVRSPGELPETIVSTIRRAVERHREEVWRRRNPPYALFAAMGGLLLGVVVLAGWIVVRGLRDIPKK